MKKVILLFNLLLILGVSTPVTIFSSVTEYTPDALSVFSGPHSLSLGGSVIALPDSPTGMLSNPAGSTVIYIPKLSILDTALPNNVKFRYVGISVPTISGTIGWSISYLNYSDEIYRIDGKEYDLSSSGDITISLNYAFPIVRNVPLRQDIGSIGANLKYIRSDFSDESLNGIALDFGCIYKIPFAEDFTSSLVFRNIGSEIKYKKIDNKLNTLINFGVEYKIPFIDNSGAYLEVENNLNNGNYICSAGLSVYPMYPITLRLGWRDAESNSSAGLRGGFGLDFSVFSLNYSVSPYRNSSTLQQISVDVAFGVIDKPKVAYEHYLKYYFEQAKDKYDKKDYIAARRGLEDILSINPGHQLSKEFLEKIGQELDNIEQQKEIGINRLLRSATVAISKNNIVKAATCYNSILNIEPENTDALEGFRRIDDILSRIKNENERQQNKDKIIKLFDIAFFLYTKGEYVASKEKFESLLEIDSENKEANKYLNDIDAQLAKVTAFQINELYIKAMSYYDNANYEEALRYFSAVATAAPHRIDAQNYVLECNKKIAESREKLNLEKNALHEKGKLNEMKNSYNSALSLYEKGYYANALEAFNKSKILAEKYKNTHYIENSKKFIKTTKNALAEKHYKLGFEYSRRNKIEAAAYEYRKALEYNAEYTDAKRELNSISEKLAQEYYERGMSLFASGDTKKAKELFKKSLFYYPGKIESQRALERIK